MLPPVSLHDLPPGGVIGRFMGISSLLFTTASGTIAVFLHDLGDDDLARIFADQRRQAEAQLGEHYARRALWWEMP